jgi:hypothetical protein
MAVSQQTFHARAGRGGAAIAVAATVHCFFFLCKVSTFCVGDEGRGVCLWFPENAAAGTVVFLHYEKLHF